LPVVINSIRGLNNIAILFILGLDLTMFDIGLTRVTAQQIQKI